MANCDESSAPDPLAKAFPPFGVRIEAGELTLRLMRDQDFPEYFELLDSPIFEDEEADHVFPWYRQNPSERQRGALIYQWKVRAGFEPDGWRLPMAVLKNGRIIGSQEISAEQFSVTRCVRSGSWLTRSEQGRGFGKLMRQMMLVFAFDYLGATRAESSAVIGNQASFGVSRVCGYELNGTSVESAGGRSVVEQRFVVTPDTLVRPDVEVRVIGLTDELREMLGVFQ
ncbi:GNAT family N-acetyltransferase [Devriesea agamarum]|uniref:GNAT family N-acetyltransferase n=1 Tax=Devriesea agamarum TaxID=472569 RepID=UPI00071CD3ED|nr:GNAT family protein [Devriesea agamarum]